MIEGDKVVESEAVMAGDEVDALPCWSIAMYIQIETARDSLFKSPNSILIPFDKATDFITESPVPFLPLVLAEAADLVQTGRVPGLGNQFGACQHWIGVDFPKDRWVHHRLTGVVARKDGCEIETEAVDVHLRGPIPQTVHDEPFHD